MVGLEATGCAERPARPAGSLVLYGRHGSEVSPVASRGRGSATAQAERAVLAAFVRRRAVLALAEGAAAVAEAQSRRLELVPARNGRRQR